MIKPKPVSGLRHLALFIREFEACERFYVELLGMAVDWRPDADNLYLSSGHDNLALHRAPAGFAPGQQQRLDHFGFIIEERDQVDAWYEYLLASGVSLRTVPRMHRDTSRSFYCLDPDGNTVQFLFFAPRKL